jgi:alpha-amylase/alpha-mannosidase (GH57 family)
VIGVNFLWHMHQPDYRPAGGGLAILPWVRLHAVRGYLDLLAVLEQHASMHCVVNFSGILLDQLLTYTSESRDLFAQLSLRDPADFSHDEVGFALANFFSANLDTLVRREPRYWELYQKRESGATDFNDQELRDILVWFNLAWIGFTGRQHGDVQELIAKGREFNADDQQQVIAIHEQLLAEVIPRYKTLADNGAIELSFTPYHHPILPLLHDLATEGTVVNGDTLPEFSWTTDAAEQVKRGMQLYERAFGRPAAGAWPAEGSVSDNALATLADAGVRWAATDQQNLPEGGLAHLQPWRWRRDGRELLLFFRDTLLADKVGFDYARWDAHDAAADLVGNIHRLGQQSGLEWPVVSVILDGENPWEAYPDGGEAFLHLLFTQLAENPDLECVTPSMLLDKQWPTLDHIHAGSWIGGNFDIWTKDKEARQAWRLLARTRIDLAGEADTPVCQSTANDADKSVCATNPALDHLLAAEGSDWFWWYGDTFQSEQKPQFDALFRGHLIRAYELAGLEVPEEMYAPILSVANASVHTEAPAIINPTIDGRADFFEWRGAHTVSSTAGQGAMATTAASGIRALQYGFGPQELYLRLDLSAELMHRLASTEPKLRVCLRQADPAKCIMVSIAPGRRHSENTRVAVRECVELAVSLGALEASTGTARLWLELVLDSDRIRFPANGMIPLHLPVLDEMLSEWIV